MKIFHVALATFFLSVIHAQDTLTWQQFTKINNVKKLIPLERIPQSFANDYKVIGYAAHIQCQGQNDGYLQEVYSFDRNYNGNRMNKEIFDIVAHFKNRYSSDCTIAFSASVIEKQAPKRLFNLDFYLVIKTEKRKPPQAFYRTQHDDSAINNANMDTSFSNSTEFLERNAAIVREWFGDFDTSHWHAQEDDRILFEKFIQCFDRKGGYDTFINFVKAQDNGMTYNSILQRVTNYEIYYRKTFRRFRYDWYTMITTELTDSTIREGYKFYKGKKMVRTVWLNFLEGKDFTGWDDKTNGDGLSEPKNLRLFPDEF